MRRTIGMAVVGLLAASAFARADVTLQGTTAGKGLGMIANGESTTYIKGNRMRNDSVLRGQTFSSIIDLDNQKFIALDHKKQEAEVFDLGALAGELNKAGVPAVNVEMNPTGQKREIAGQACEEYTMSATADRVIGDMKMTVVMTGPVWIAPDSPGKEDYARFYRAAAEKGFFFNNPKAAKADPGQARAWSALYEKMAAAGVAYGSDISVKIKGDGPMAALMGKMGGTSVSNTVTRVAADPLADDLFAVPAGWKTKAGSY